MQYTHYVCDFGERHGIAETCGCKEKHRVYPVQYRIGYMQRGYRYSKDVPESVKHEILSKIPKF